jgi:hypothetical protein
VKSFVAAKLSVKVVTIDLLHGVVFPHGSPWLATLEFSRELLWGDWQPKFVEVTVQPISNFTTRRCFVFLN